MMSSLYSQTASVLAGVLAKRASLKTLTFNSSKVDPRNRRACFAIVSETLKYLPGLFVALDATPLAAQLKYNPERRATVLLMLHDLLLRHKISGSGGLKKARLLSSCSSHKK